MTRILLIRHGHVEGILPKRFRGRLDLELSKEGRAQAAEAARYVEAGYKPEAVYSSPLRRCVDTATALTTCLSLPQPVIAPGLTDIDYGLWQGRLATEVAAAEPARYALWQSAPEQMIFPQGESLAAVAGRTVEALRSLVERHAGQCIAVFSHDSVIRVLLLAALGAPLAAYHRVCVDPCSLSELLCEGSGPIEILRINERTGQGAVR